MDWSQGFFQPIQLDIQAANLFIGLPPVFFRRQGCSWGTALKKARHLPGQLFFPDRDLGRMYLEGFGPLLERVYALHRLQGHLGFKLGTMPFPLFGDRTHLSPNRLKKLPSNHPN